MNRKHTYEDFKVQVEYLRSHDPLFSISTDIIVGFPGETEEEFQATVRAMQECQFDFAYIARYSPRSGTSATDTMEDEYQQRRKLVDGLYSMISLEKPLQTDQDSSSEEKRRYSSVEKMEMEISLAVLGISRKSIFPTIQISKKVISWK
jgi:tRNA A37 methylthiotransferase MiaB